MNQLKIEQKDIIIIGGGAAGVFAAIEAARRHPQLKVAILEATHRPLTKVKISGGGRCNVTHHCFEVNKLIEAYPRGAKELRSVFSRFQPQDTVAWFESRGVALKTEADGRMFPQSNKSQTIIDCLLGEAEKYGVELIKGEMVKSVRRDSLGFHIETRRNVFQANKLMLATGSMPKGYQIAEGLGHKITELVPSLFTFQVSDQRCHELAGVSVASVDCKLTLPTKGRKTFKFGGPFLFTHWGFSGPAVLKLSAFAARELYHTNYQGQLRVDFLPFYSQDQLFDMLLKIKAMHPNRKTINEGIVDLPKRLWKFFVSNLQLQDLTWSDMSNQHTRRLVESFKQAEFSIEGKGEFKEEFVTCGGVYRKDIDFRTMQSKICEGLYFAGEVIDIDGITGGFNFQNAWSTSWIAAQSMAEDISPDQEGVIG